MPPEELFIDIVPNSMKQYEVTITVVVRTTLLVEADSEEEAKELAEKEEENASLNEYDEIARGYTAIRVH